MVTQLERTSAEVMLRNEVQSVVGILYSFILMLSSKNKKPSFQIQIRSSILQVNFKLRRWLENVLMIVLLFPSSFSFPYFQLGVLGPGSLVTIKIYSYSGP